MKGAKYLLSHCDLEATANLIGCLCIHSKVGPTMGSTKGSSKSILGMKMIHLSCEEIHFAGPLNMGPRILNHHIAIMNLSIRQNHSLQLRNIKNFPNFKQRKIRSHRFTKRRTSRRSATRYFRSGSNRRLWQFRTDVFCRPPSNRFQGNKNLRLMKLNRRHDLYRGKKSGCP